LANGHNVEQGFWDYQVIPEPSICSLFAGGFGLWLIKKRRVSKSPTLR
jgi:hypothetical protein